MRAASNGSLAIRSATQLNCAARFYKQHWLCIFLVSALLLIPCFWHRHIEAGDLSSHVYNAWLVDLILHGQVTDLYVAPQSNNVLFDMLLYSAGRFFGSDNAEKIVVPPCVLIFFWGSFALLAAASRRPPWLLTPALAMIAYGFTFEMGFMNYYLSAGLGFFVVALLWQGAQKIDLPVAGVLTILVYLAHPVGLLTLLGITLYVKLTQWLRGWWRVLPFALAVLTLVAISRYLTQFRTAGWIGASFFQMNGFDQLMLFSPLYGLLDWLMFLFTSVAIGDGLVRSRRTGPIPVAVIVAAGLWAMLLLSALLIPEAIWLPQFAGVVAMAVERSTCISGVMLLLALACMEPKRWHIAVYGLAAAVFFGLLWKDTGRLDRLESEARKLLHTLPEGSRVVSTLGPTPGSRLWFVLHIVDRACLGHCFTYSNYEPSTGQFWIHARPGSRTASSSARDIELLQLGTYQVRQADLPLTQIYQCQLGDFDHLCLRKLKAEVPNCPGCNNPFRAFTKR